ncbi:MAG: FkbM family methyltransferase [Planctomycetales bacterium]|nr:FkbM family methyltransferase [Planctomycetales bacterium]
MIPLKLLHFIWNHPSNKGRRVQALCRSVGWQIHKRIRRTPQVHPMFDGVKLKCYPESNGAGLMIYTNGWPDYDEMHFVRRYLRPGDAFVDVGTNIGIFTLLASTCVGTTGHVLSLEANGRSFERLLENVQLNQFDSIVEAHCAAVGAENGTIRFLKGWDLINRIATEAEQQSGELPYDEVPSVKLDDKLSGRRFAMGKIDIEGAEPLAFRGAAEMLNAGNPPVWLMELKSHLLARFDTTPEMVRDMLAEHQYRLANYDADQNKLTFPEEAWQGHGDVLAIHEPSLEEIQARLSITQ